MDECSRGVHWGYRYCFRALVNDGGVRCWVDLMQGSMIPSEGNDEVFGLILSVVEEGDHVASVPVEHSEYNRVAANTAGISWAPQYAFLRFKRGGSCGLRSMTRKMN